MHVGCGPVLRDYPVLSELVVGRGTLQGVWTVLSVLWEEEGGRCNSVIPVCCGSYALSAVDYCQMGLNMNSLLTLGSWDNYSI